MTALIIIVGILLLFAALLFLPSAISLHYEDELRAYIRVLFVRIRVYPREKRRRGPFRMSRRKAARILAEVEKKKLKKKKRKLEKLRKKKARGKKKLSDILDTVRNISSISSSVIGKFGKRLRTKISRLEIIVATPDAAQTAIAFGAVHAALEQLYTALGESKRFKLPKPERVLVKADFEHSVPSAKIKIKFSFSLFALIAALFSTFFTKFMEKEKQKAIAAARAEALARREAAKATQNNASK